MQSSERERLAKQSMREEDVMEDMKLKSEDGKVEMKDDEIRKCSSDVEGDDGDDDAFDRESDVEADALITWLLMLFKIVDANAF
jgi:hypothetical protein